MSKTLFFYSDSLSHDLQKWKLIELGLQTLPGTELVKYESEAQLNSQSKYWYLHENSAGLIQLFYKDELLNAGRPLVLQTDFQNDSEYSRKTNSIKKELLVKAMGIEDFSSAPRVLDATLGLAIDAMFLIRHDFAILGVERHPLVYLCLQSAWSLLDSKLKSQLQIHFGDVKELRADQWSTFPQAIYFDPMFPSKKKTALPRQEMQILKLINESYGESDPQQCFQQLRLLQQSIVKHQQFTRKRLRLVVKRSLEAPPFELTQLSYRSKLVRYDVYEEKGSE